MTGPKHSRLHCSLSDGICCRVWPWKKNPGTLQQTAWPCSSWVCLTTKACVAVDFAFGRPGWKLKASALAEVTEGKRHHQLCPCNSVLIEKYTGLGGLDRDKNWSWVEKFNIRWVTSEVIQMNTNEKALNNSYSGFKVKWFNLIPW